MKRELTDQKNRRIPARRTQGQDVYIRFCRLNAVSAICISESTLILYALKMGLSEVQAAILASFMTLTLPMAFLGRHLIAFMGLVRTVSATWLLRNFFSALMAAAPLFFDPAASEDAAQKVFWVLGCGLMFCLLRGTGLVAFPSLEGEISTETTRGRVISRIVLNDAGFSLLMMITIASVLRRNSSVEVFQGIFCASAVVGALSTFVIRRVPESGFPRISAKQPLLGSVRNLWQNSRWRRFLFAHAAATSASLLVIPFSMMMLKQGYRIGDGNVFLFVVVQTLGGIATAFLNRIISDRSGPRPLLILYVSGFLAVSLLWVAVPASFSGVFTCSVFLLLGGSFAGMLATLNHLFLAATPSDERVAGSLFIGSVSGLCAGLAVGAAGAGILKIIELAGITGLAVYRIYFLVVSAVLFILLGQVRRLKMEGNWSVSDVAGSVFRFRWIRTVCIPYGMTGCRADESPSASSGRTGQRGSH